jgi:hypothetical protein
MAPIAPHLQIFGRQNFVAAMAALIFLSMANVINYQPVAATRLECKRKFYRLALTGVLIHINKYLCESHSTKSCRRRMYLVSLINQTSLASMRALTHRKKYLFEPKMFRSPRCGLFFIAIFGAMAFAMSTNRSPLCGLLQNFTRLLCQSPRCVPSRIETNICSNVKHFGRRAAACFLLSFF